MIHFTMQVEELLRTHPSLGDFISQSKLEALDLTKQLELHIKSGYFEIVKAAEQLMKLSSTVKSAKELISPLPPASQVELTTVTRLKRTEDDVWERIDGREYAEAVKACIAGMRGDCSEELRDIYYYVREVALPAFAEDSETTVANKLAACCLVHVHENDVLENTDIGPVLLSTFVSRLVTDLELVVADLDCDGIQRLGGLLTSAQSHYAHSFVDGGVAGVLREVGAGVQVGVQADGERLIADALGKVIDTVRERVKSVIESVTDPMTILEVKLGGVEKYGIFSLKNLAQPMWLHQLYTQSLSRLAQFQFLQSPSPPTPPSLLSAYNAENSSLLSALFPFASDPDLSPTLSLIVTEHLHSLSEQVTALVSTTESSEAILSLAFFLHTVPARSPNLARLIAALGVPETDLHSHLFPLWTAKLTERPTLDTLREVRKVCGDEVSFCSSVIPQACPQLLDPRKSTISTVFGLQGDEAESVPAQSPLPDLPQLPYLQLLPRFAPHLVYT